MAQTRMPLQLDDLAEGDEVEFLCRDGTRLRGIYARFKRLGDSGVWTLRVYRGAQLYPSSINSQAVRSVRILRPAVQTEERGDL